MKYLFLVFIELLLFSCMQNLPKDRLYNAIMEYDYYIAIPITNQKDSCLYMCESLTFYEMSNMDILDRDVFLTNLYKHIKKNTYIELTDSLYNELSLNSVCEDIEIKNTYQRQGIEGLLDRYTRRVSTLSSYASYIEGLSWKQIEYIMYLLYCEGVYTEFSDEDGDIFIVLDSK